MVAVRNNLEVVRQIIDIGYVRRFNQIWLPSEQEEPDTVLSQEAALQTHLGLSEE